MGKSSSSPPDARGAAEAEGEFSERIARAGTYADRPDQSNPFGDLKWTQESYTDPATGEQVTKWGQNQSLAGGIQDSFDSSVGMMGNRAKLA